MGQLQFVELPELLAVLLGLGRRMCGWAKSPVPIHSEHHL